MILAFIFLFKIGRPLGKMSIVYKEVGFEIRHRHPLEGAWLDHHGHLHADRRTVRTADGRRARAADRAAMAATNILFSVLHWVGQNELVRHCSDCR